MYDDVLINKATRMIERCAARAPEEYQKDPDTFSVILLVRIRPY